MRLLRMLGVMVVLLSIAPTLYAADVSEKASLERGQIAARMLLKVGRFAEALAVLRPLAKAHPKHTNVLFLLGLAALQHSQGRETLEAEREGLLDEAIAALFTILVDHPALVRVRLELARAFFYKQEDGLAQDQFDLVLSTPQPGPVVDNINQFLSIMRARRRWNGYFGFSLAPDTNVNAASNATGFVFQGQPRAGDWNPTNPVTSDIGLVGWGGAEYQYPLGNRLRLRTGFDVNHREYKGRVFDQTFVGLYAGPRWFVSRNTEASLLAAANQFWFGGYSFNYSLGMRVEVNSRLFPGAWVNGLLSWQHRIHQQNKALEGPLTVFSLGASYAFLPTVQFNGLVGYSQQEARAPSWSNSGYWIRGGTNVALPWGFTVGLSGEFRWTDFNDDWSFFTNGIPSREDQTRILQATLLNRAVTVYGFSPQVVFSNEVRTTNAQLYDFKRNRVEMRFVRQF